LNERDRERLREIVEYGERAVRLMAGRNAVELTADEAARFAIRYCIQIIGEAAGKLSSETRDLMPLLPWRDIVNMRHRLAHGYMDIEDRVLHDTVNLDLPALLLGVRRSLEDADSNEGDR
jgi:uncharacterized protein with HEPN domain